MRWNGDFQGWLDAHANVFRRSHALERGMSARQFRTGVSRGDWVPFRGVWIVANAPANHAAQSWAALLKCGPTARLTGVTALSLHGLEVCPWGIHISVPSDSRATAPHALILRDTCRVDTDNLRRGIPTVGRERAVVDALRVLDEAAGRDVLHEALRRRWVTVEGLEAWRVRLAKHRGMPRLRGHLAEAKTGTIAESERVLRSLIVRAGFTGWRFNDDIRSDDDELLGIGDCVHREKQIVIELDGMAWHTAPDRFQRDRSRQNALVNSGWHILRFTWSDLTTRPHHVLHHIRVAMDRNR